MTSAYLVTERETDLALLKKLLPFALATDLVFYATQGKSSVYSAAGTLLSDRARPVVIVLDAETQNIAEIQEKISLANTLLLPAAPLGVPFKVLFATPTIASILLSDPPVRLDSHPDLEEINQMTAAQIQTLQRHPLIQQLIEFLSGVCQQIA
ncbi:hypothetical protein LEP3755_64320 (plasmid) [Leptolyngbya sp. NIES-3755]|nr:hypothetical protein LEP3755_64320 [Leptolyngbya sp. NIES-3755]